VLPVWHLQTATDWERVIKIKAKCKKSNKKNNKKNKAASGKFILGENKSSSRRSSSSSNS